jgi:hypothetical protein
MKRIRYIFAFCALTLAFAALAMVLMNRGGGDALDDGEMAAVRAAEFEGYFEQMSAINRKSDEQFEKTVFVDQENAKAYADAFDSVLAMLEAEYGKVMPPSELTEEHKALIRAIKEYRVGIDHGLRPLDIDAPAADFETLFSDVLADEDLRVSSAFCKIQDVAKAEGIKADVGCQQT